MGKKYCLLIMEVPASHWTQRKYFLSGIIYLSYLLFDKNQSHDIKIHRMWVYMLQVKIKFRFSFLSQSGFFYGLWNKGRISWRIKKIFFQSKKQETTF